MTKTITSFPISWYSAFLQSKLIAEQSKLETVKMIGACSKTNAISLNIKINKRKSVDVCGYKLPINVQNFMQKDATRAKISSKVVGGLLFFDSPCISLTVVRASVQRLCVTWRSAWRNALHCNHCINCLYEVIHEMSIGAKMYDHK